MSAADLDEIVIDRLRSAEQRYTRGRRRILAALRASAAPLTIPQILVFDERLSQSSVYRNLAILEDVGVVTRIVTSDDFARYELAEDLTGHHHHLICTSCGSVADFALPSAAERDLDRALQRIASEHGFEADNHRLDLVGRCPDCVSEHT